MYRSAVRIARLPRLELALFRRLLIADRIFSLCSSVFLAFGHCPGPPPRAAFAVSMICFRVGSGRLGQVLTTRAKSGYFCDKSAKQDAKTLF
jgi:hypothetical protein